MVPGRPLRPNQQRRPNIQDLRGERRGCWRIRIRLSPRYVSLVYYQSLPLTVVDGEWISTIIDDKLYLTKRDYDESYVEREQWNDIMNRQDPEEEYRKAYQTGSRALYFAQCSTANETWLPLLEKAYAKAHGDFGSIEGGYTG